jgi:hypothetical protein
LSKSRNIMGSLVRISGISASRLAPCVARVHPSVAPCRGALAVGFLILQGLE